MATYKFRFWYCHQEVVITGITADELVQSLFFPESLEMKDFYRTAYLEGENGPFPIEVTIHDLEHLTIYHMKKEDPESLDVHFGEKNGKTELGDDFWILEEETPENENQDEKEFSKE
jgi:hypothetical protein